MHIHIRVSENGESEENVDIWARQGPAILEIFVFSFAVA